jgi:acetyltransferase
MAYGLPVIRTEIAKSEAQALSIGKEVGCPLVMKVNSPDITHKTDAGGIRLDLRCDADVCEAYKQIISSARLYKPDARIEGRAVKF